MSKTLKNIIESLLKESTRFNSNDVLVNCHTENSGLMNISEETTFSIKEFPQKILNESRRTFKESGVNSLCKSKGLVRLLLNEKDIFTPIFLIPVEYKADKVKGEIQLLLDEENSFVNPFLLFHLENTLEVEQKLIAGNIPENFGELLNDLGLETQEQSYLGNFHHHRYQVIRELEELLSVNEYSSGIHTLLGLDSEEVFKLSLPPDLVYPADTDHEKVFLKIENDHTVIQGPPGTGKSQVLTNIIAKLLKSAHNSIIISEKRVALEVIKKKLGEYDLDRLCFIASSDSLSRQLLIELKSNWEFFEQFQNNKEMNLRLSEQYLDNLQMTLDVLSNESLVGGVSLYDFKKLCNGLDLEGATYSSSVVGVDQYLKIKEMLESLYDQGLQEIVGQLLHQSLSKESIKAITEKIHDWQKLIEILQESFECRKWSELETAMKHAADCQIFENEIYRKYYPIFKLGSREQKNFLNLRKEWIKANQGLVKDDNWIIPPSIAETNGLLKMLNGQGNFFTRLRAKKRWKELSDIPFESARMALTEHQLHLEQNEYLSQIKFKFCDLGIDNVEIELPLIYQTLHVFSEEKWKELELISDETRAKITTHHRALSKLREELSKYFNFDPNTDVITYLQAFNKTSGTLLSQSNELQFLDKNALTSIRNNSTFEALEKQLFYSHLIDFDQQFPALSKFNISDIHAKAEHVITAEIREYKLFAKELLSKSASRFNRFHELLATPARKLSEDEKELKATLRKGKSILVREFAKTRNHPSLRELYNSEARIWIQLLKPVWLSNPSQIAKCFPMEKDLFDVAIFDEASQIVLQDALGTIHRARRIIVAGDENQMGPSQYFKSGNTEPTDLLHQASYNWAKIPLQHHYRSTNPELIAFSNKYFYGNSLKAFPSSNCGKAIKMQRVSGGEFLNRKNIEEAKAAAALITKYLDEQNNIGVVAFSEEQLHCIWEHLTIEAQHSLNSLIDSDKAFFKALENVQGDECDKLVVSFGYAKNENGEFHMRFGPMNTINGRKRLNVLLTRATQSIDFFCSVDSSAFKISENESVELLRKWFQFMETHQEFGQSEFPYDLDPQIEGNLITLTAIHEKIKNARELITLQSVLEGRGWKIQYN